MAYSAKLFMEILKIDQTQPSAAFLWKAVEALKNGKVVLHPTETCYGFAVDIFQKNAIKLLYTFKQMPFDKPVSMMVRDLQEAQQYAEFHDMALQLAERFWPGPVTLVLPRRNTLPDFFNPGHATVGIRCPDSVVSRQLIEGAGRPLSTTSANVSTLPETYGVEDFLKQLKPDTNTENLFILDAGKLSKNLPSTLVGFENEEPVILREGGLLEDVKSFLEII